MPRNYYVVLGLTPTASAEQIKGAFRRLAKELHPDRSGTESAPFRELREAYSVLSDLSRRRRYDHQASARQPTTLSASIFGKVEPLVPPTVNRPFGRPQGEPFAGGNTSHDGASVEVFLVGAMAFAKTDSRYVAVCIRTC